MTLTSFNFAYCSCRTNEKGDKRNGKDSKGRGMDREGRGRERRKGRNSDLYKLIVLN